MKLTLSTKLGVSSGVSESCTTFVGCWVATWVMPNLTSALTTEGSGCQLSWRSLTVIVTEACTPAVARVSDCPVGMDLPRWRRAGWVTIRNGLWLIPLAPNTMLMS